MQQVVVAVEVLGLVEPRGAHQRARSTKGLSWRCGNGVGFACLLNPWQQMFWAYQGHNGIFSTCPSEGSFFCFRINPNHAAENNWLLANNPPAPCMVFPDHLQHLLEVLLFTDLS